MYLTEHLIGTRYYLLHMLRATRYGCRKSYGSQYCMLLVAIVESEPSEYAEGLSPKRTHLQRGLST